MNLAKETSEILFDIASHNKTDDIYAFGNICQNISVHANNEQCKLIATMKDTEHTPDMGMIHYTATTNKEKPYRKEVLTNGIQYEIDVTEKEIRDKTTPKDISYFQKYLETIKDKITRENWYDVLLIQFNRVYCNNKNADIKVLVTNDVIKPEEATYLYMNYKVYTRIEKYKTISNGENTIECFELITEKQYKEEQEYLSELRKKLGGNDVGKICNTIDNI